MSLCRGCFSACWLCSHDANNEVLCFVPWRCCREQRQKETSSKSTPAVNSFPKDRDYRREAMQATATSAFPATSKGCSYVHQLALTIAAAFPQVLSVDLMT